MNNNVRLIWWIIGIVIVGFVAWGIWTYANPQNAASTTATTTATSSSSADQSAASQLVITFGSHLKNVSLLAPDASSTIATEYGPFVDPSLLATWEADPSIAPGRQTSSPYPDHIEVTSVQPSAQGYVVQGMIAMVTSTGTSSTVAFSAYVQKLGDAWYISSFAENPGS